MKTVTKLTAIALMMINVGVYADTAFTLTNQASGTITFDCSKTSGVSTCGAPEGTNEYAVGVHTNQPSGTINVSLNGTVACSAKLGYAIIPSHGQSAYEPVIWSASGQNGHTCGTTGDEFHWGGYGAVILYT